MKDSVFKIGRLSNADLLIRFGKLVQTERKITHLVLECIAEIDTRKIYLDKAYPSLYEFLVQDFGYSSSAAIRRIESARLLREVPEVAAKIESGALNLSQLSKVQQAVRTVLKNENRKMDAEEKKDLLNRIEHTSQQQTEVILCQALSLPILVENKEKAHGDESVTLTMTFSKEQIVILKQAQDLIAHSVPEKNWAEAFTYLAKKEIHRRTNLKSTPATVVEKGTDLPHSKRQAESVVSIEPRKSVPLAPLAIDRSMKQPQENHGRKAINRTVKNIILHQQKCCQYKDRLTGKICGSTRFLQIDHRQAVWAGGTNAPENLQVLCAQHNQHKYRQESFLV